MSRKKKNGNQDIVQKVLLITAVYVLLKEVIVVRKKRGADKIKISDMPPKERALAEEIISTIEDTMNKERPTKCKGCEERKRADFWEMEAKKSKVFEEMAEELFDHSQRTKNFLFAVMIFEFMCIVCIYLAHYFG